MLPQVPVSITLEGVQLLPDVSAMEAQTWCVVAPVVADVANHFTSAVDAYSVSLPALSLEAPSHVAAGAQRRAQSAGGAADTEGYATALCPPGGDALSAEAPPLGADARPVDPGSPLAAALAAAGLAAFPQPGNDTCTINFNVTLPPDCEFIAQEPAGGAPGGLVVTHGRALAQNRAEAFAAELGSQRVQEKVASALGLSPQQVRVKADPMRAVEAASRSDAAPPPPSPAQPTEPTLSGGAMAAIGAAACFIVVLVVAWRAKVLDKLRYPPPAKPVINPFASLLVLREQTPSPAATVAGASPLQPEAFSGGDEKQWGSGKEPRGAGSGGNPTRDNTMAVDTDPRANTAPLAVLEEGRWPTDSAIPGMVSLW